MKKTIRAVLMLASMSAGFAAPGKSEKISIPFSFKLGNKAMQAGPYHLMTGPLGQTAMLVNDQTRHCVQLLRQPPDGSGKAALVFQRTSKGMVLAKLR